MRVSVDARETWGAGSSACGRFSKKDSPSAWERHKLSRRRLNHASEVLVS